MPTRDPVSKELRAAEEEIDRFHLTNPLVQQPFGPAAWYFLAHCEEVHVHQVVRGDMEGEPESLHDFASVADNVIVHAKWPLEWLRNACQPGGTIPTRYNDRMYEAARQLSHLALDYMSFESAFTYASLGILDLHVEDNHVIRASDTMRGDTRYDAYDRLATVVTPGPTTDELQHILDRVASSVQVQGETFKWTLNPRLVADAVAAFSQLEDRFTLPRDWQLTRYTIGHFAQVGRVLTAIAALHYHARLVAARQGCVGLGYAGSILLMEKAELFQRLRRYTTVPTESLRAVIQDLTYGERGIRRPDPALQPLVQLTASVYAIAPSLFISNALERNLVVLLNRLPEERLVYSGLSTLKEGLSREWIEEELLSLNVRLWTGDVPGWEGASQVDCVIISDAQKQCLIFELKSFLAPAEAREIRDRSEEIARGIEQIRLRRALAAQYPDALHETLGVGSDYCFSWAVASDTSIGAVYVQADDVPVINTGHLIRKLQSDGNLVQVCEWLESRAYLPVEGVHYRVVDDRATVGRWSLEWYGIHGLVDDYL